MDFSKVAVLVVDDSASSRRIVIEICKDLGMTKIEEAEDAHQAYVKVKVALDKDPFNLIICDHNMPGASGLEFLKKLNADRILKGVAFIVVTAEGQAKNVLDYAYAGATGFIVKPVRVKALRDKIIQVMDRVKASVGAAQ